METFSSRVAVSLADLVSLGSQSADRTSLYKHLLAVSVKDDVGELVVDNATFKIVGVLNNEIVFQIDNLSIKPKAQKITIHEPIPFISEVGVPVDQQKEVDNNTQEQPSLPKNILTPENEESIKKNRWSLKTLFGY